MIDLTGLSSFDRATVIARRKDCHVDLTGLDPDDEDWALESRPDYTPSKR
jgi:hypothetical protein